MRTLGLSILILGAAAFTCRAQQWEVGGIGGGGFLSNVGVPARSVRQLPVSRPAPLSGPSSATTPTAISAVSCATPICRTIYNFRAAVPPSRFPVWHTWCTMT